MSDTFFQHYALFSHMTVEENVAAGLGHMEKARKGRIVEEQLRVFQLEELRGRYPRELSGGQQRVSRLRACWRTCRTC